MEQKRFASKMPHHHFPRFSFLKFALTRELDELYISIALRFFALSMIGIFVPLYLLREIGISLPRVLYFYIIFALVFIVFAFVGAKIAARVGFKHSILISIPFSIAFFIGLRLLLHYSLPLELIAGLDGIAAGFYWMGHHTDFAKFSIGKARGEEVGIVNAIVGLAAVIGPLVGGIVIHFFGFVVLFSIVSLLLFLSALPLFFSPELHEPVNFSLRYIFRKEHLRDAAAYTAYGMEHIASAVLWPIFIFTFLVKYLTLGAVITTAGLAVSGLSIFVGKLSDRIGKKKVIRVGALFDSGLWIVKGFVRTILHIYTVTILAGVFSLSLLPLDARVYDKANSSKRIVEYLVFRELFVNLGRIILMLFMIIVGSFAASFILTGFAELAYLLF